MRSTAAEELPYKQSGLSPLQVPSRTFSAGLALRACTFSGGGHGAGLGLAWRYSREWCGSASRRRSSSVDRSCKR